MAATVRAPFPWAGGKRRWGPRVWARLGAPDVYAEPFAGSAALLLAAPAPAGMETICDTDGLLVNAWRALRADPDAVARWADYPTIHPDLTARHHWLRRWRSEHLPRLAEDPDWCDPKAAGWWLWGTCIWIGMGWCGAAARVPDRVPKIAPDGTGVSRQRRRIGGRPRSAQALRAWFEALAARLARTIILCRPWTSGVTRAALHDYPRYLGGRAVRAVVLDPPYEGTSEGFYFRDPRGGGAVAKAAWEWALQHGARRRIAYFERAGSVMDVTRAPGWSVETMRLVGYARRPITEACWYSPACLAPDEAA